MEISLHLLGVGKKNGNEIRHFSLFPLIVTFQSRMLKRNPKNSWIPTWAAFRHLFQNDILSLKYLIELLMSKNDIFLSKCLDITQSIVTMKNNCLFLTNNFKSQLLIQIHSKMILKYQTYLNVKLDRILKFFQVNAKI